MPDIDPKLAVNLGNINLKSVPNLNVNPVPQTGGPTPDVITALQNAVTALQAANSALTARVAELEKSNVAIRLVMQGIDPAFTAVKQEIAALNTEYQAHTHSLPFDFESFDFIQDTPGNNKPNFLMAYVWEGAADKSLNQWQRQEEAQTLGQRTGPVVKKS